MTWRAMSARPDSAGTPNYMAPELLAGKPYNEKVGTSFVSFGGVNRDRLLCVFVTRTTLCCVGAADLDR